MDDPQVILGTSRSDMLACLERDGQDPATLDLGLNVMLHFVSPVLEFLLIMWSQTGVRLRLVSHSLRCLQLAFTYLEYIDVVDAPLLERLLQCETVGEGGMKSTMERSEIKIGRAPNLRLPGYLLPGEQQLVAGSRENIAPTVKILGIEVQFGVRNVVKKVSAFLRCFPNLDTLHVHSPPISEESTGKVNLKFWQEGGPIKCVVQSVKKVFFYEFQGSRSEVAFLKFIAERGRVLERMVVVVSSKCFSSSSVGNADAKLMPLMSAKWNNKACKLELFRSGREDAEGPVYSHELASDFEFADPFDLEDYMKQNGSLQVN
ncbi:hypothetical protein VPH35_055314 [Triticum aestivum]|uniref:Uncharacterized protein n=1 Tax=Triticum aestivum TaxID=4565 RepID=A0A077S770_WHEAT|nr:unnamed protein product [Triticum aestivum]